MLAAPPPPLRVGQWLLAGSPAHLSCGLFQAAAIVAGSLRACACLLAWFTESGPGPDRLLPLAPSQRGCACALQEVMARLNQIFSARKITFGSKVRSCEGAGMFCHVVG